MLESVFQCQAFTGKSITYLKIAAPLSAYIVLSSIVSSCHIRVDPVSEF